MARGKFRFTLQQLWLITTAAAVFCSIATRVGLLAVDVILAMAGLFFFTGLCCHLARRCQFDGEFLGAAAAAFYLTAVIAVFCNPWYLADIFLASMVLMAPTALIWLVYWREEEYWRVRQVAWRKALPAKIEVPGGVRENRGN